MTVLYGFAWPQLLFVIAVLLAANVVLGWWR